MSAAYYPQVQEIYVAYYGRPADPAGLQYWAGQLAANGGNLNAIINAFGTSAESTALYAGASNAAKVTAIYQQLFNRAPETTGLNFYTSALTAGTMTAASIALNVADGASGADLTTLNNKITVASAFTDALTVDGAAAVAYVGTTAANTARSLISGVTTSAATTNVASTVATIKSGGGAAAGQTFTLTSDTDNQDFSSYTSGVKIVINGDDDAAEGDEFDVTGSAYNDTVVLDTYLRADVNAGAGTDTLDLRDVGLTLAAGEADVNLATGVANAALDGTFINFENVIANENGGRLVGTTGANVITLGEGDDDISAAGGDDTILADEDTLTNGDAIDGGSGTDTLSIDAMDTLNLQTAFGALTNVENILLTGTEDADVELDVDDLFNNDGSVAIVGGIRNIKVSDVGGDNSVAIGTNAAINLIGVSFTNVQTLVTNAGAAGGNVRIDTNSLVGVEAIEGTAGDDLDLSGGGTFDLSGLVITGTTDIDGSATRNEKLLLGRAIGDITAIDLLGSTADELSFANTDVADVSAVAIADVETLSFGSASRVVVDGDIGDVAGSTLAAIKGTAGEDTLVFEEAPGGSTVVLTTVAITDVETIINEAAGGDVDFTIGAGSLSAGTVVIGDSGVDEVIFGENGVDVSKVTFKDFERLDFGANTGSISVATFAGFATVDGTLNGVLTFTDSGNITLSTPTGATMTGAARIQGFSGDDTFTLSNFGDVADFELRTGSGNDTVIFSGTGNSVDTTAVNLQDGNDTLNIGSVVTAATLGTASGGNGTDTLVVGANIVASALTAADFVGFEVLKWSGATTDAISVIMDADDIQVQTIDLSPDASAAGGSTITLTGYNASGYTVIGTAGIDTITMGSTSSTVQAGGGNDVITVAGSAAAMLAAAEAQSFVITGGAGADAITFAANTVATTVGQHALTVTDFGAGDTLNVVAIADAGGAVTPVLITQSIAQAHVNAANGGRGPGSLAQAFEALNDTADALNSAIVATFQYDGDTYVYIDTGDAATYSATTDYFIKLTGLVTVADAQLTIN